MTAQESLTAWAGLHPAHTKLLMDSAVSQEVAESRGYRTIINKAELEALGFSRYQQRVPGLLIPLYSPGAVRTGGKPSGYQYRPDNPRKDNKGRLVKYETPTGQPSLIDVHPHIIASLADPSTPLYITEGARKTDAGVTAGLTIVGLQGVWNWRTKQGRDTLGVSKHAASAVSPDLDEIPLDGRMVYIVFDSDVIDKAEVGLAVSRLGAVLRRRGAKVRVMRLPDGADGEKVGLDDFLAAGGSIAQVPVDVGLTQQADKEEPDVDLSDELRRLALERYDLGRARNFGPYVVEKEGPNVALPLDNTFKPMLAALWTEERDDTPSTHAVSSAHQVLQGMAMSAPEQDSLPVRVAKADDAYVIDMADQSGRAIVIRAGEWEVVDRSPVLFRRGAAMRPLPEPIPGGNPFELMAPFVRAEDEDTQHLAVAWAASVAMGDILHPIVYVSGASGSGKTQTAVWLKSAIDPSDAAFQRFQNERDNLVAASASWSFIYDNLGTAEERNVPFWDFACGLVTGTGYTARALFTNLDTVSVNLRRCVLMTSVEELAVPEDAAERMIHWDVPSLRGGGRQSLLALEREWARRHPYILGAMLDLVAEATARMDVLDMEGLEGLRFTDFGAFLRAVDATYGTATLAAYRDSLAATVADRAAVSPFVMAVRMLVDASGGVWEGSARELLQGLSAVASETGLGAANLPDSADKVGRALSREDATLLSEGVAVVKKRVRGRRVIRLERLGRGPTTPNGGPQGDTIGPQGDGGVTLSEDILSPQKSQSVLGEIEDSTPQGDTRTLNLAKSPIGSGCENLTTSLNIEKDAAEIPSPLSPQDGKANNDGQNRGAARGDSRVALGAQTVTLALGRDAERVLAVLEAAGGAPLSMKSILEGSGLTDTRAKRALDYLRSFGVVEEAVRSEQPDLAWGRGVGRGWRKLPVAVQVIDRTTHNVVLFDGSLGWAGDTWQEELEATPGGADYACGRCGERYTVTERGWLHSCGKCRHTG